jgi:hypothetical protein
MASLFTARARVLPVPERLNLRLRHAALLLRFVYTFNFYKRLHAAPEREIEQK